MREKLSKELQTNYKKDIRRKNTEEQLTVQQQPSAALPLCPAPAR
jgi:hypothetical protein